MDLECAFCPTPAVGICCSTHNRPMCHYDYRRTHFVEMCIEGCAACTREALPVKLDSFGPREVTA